MAVQGHSHILAICSALYAGYTGYTIEAIYRLCRLRCILLLLLLLQLQRCRNGHLRGSWALALSGLWSAMSASEWALLNHTWAWTGRSSMNSMRRVIGIDSDSKDAKFRSWQYGYGPYGNNIRSFVLLCSSYGQCNGHRIHRWVFPKKTVASDHCKPVEKVHSFKLSAVAN